MKKNKYFCYEVYKNLAIWSHNGRIKYTPCSFYTGDIGTDDNISIAKVWNNKKHIGIKKLIESDQKVPGCINCYNDEALGLTSRRQGVVELYENFFNDSDTNSPGPISIDYSVGNLCNLKCLVCNPGNSSSWVPDYQKLFPEADATKFKYQKNNQIEITDNQLQNIRNVHFHGGGEPLLSDSHITFLKNIKKVKGLSDVHVFYNTNGTVRVSDEILNLWSECRLVELYFSIDDIEQRFEYQRPGVSWERITENLTWYKENMPVNHMFKVNCVYSYLNFYYLDQLVDWHKMNLKENRLGDPVNLIFQKVLPYPGLHDFRLEFLDKTQYNILRNKFADYPMLLQLLKSIPIREEFSHQKFLDQIDKFDNLRSTKFEKTHAEWKEVLTSII
jgi:hypothetical protein